MIADFASTNESHFPPAGQTRSEKIGERSHIQVLLAVVSADEECKVIQQGNVRIRPSLQHIFNGDYLFLYPGNHC